MTNLNDQITTESEPVEKYIYRCGTPKGPCDGDMFVCEYELDTYEGRSFMGRCGNGTIRRFDFVEKRKVIE